MIGRGDKVSPRAIIAKAQGDDLSEIERLAAKYTPGLTKAIMAYLDAMRGSVDLVALAEAIKSGSVDKVIGLLAGATAAAEESITNALQDAVWGGAGLAAGQINLQLSGAHFAFDRLNPRLIDWLKSYSFNLIRQINDGTKEAIREKLVAGMNQGDNPIKTAREVRGAIGLTRRQQLAVSNYRKELETFHQRRSGGGYNLGQPIDRVNGRQVFRPDEDGLPRDGITERRLRDFRYDGQLTRAVTTGKPLKPEQIDKMVAAYERKYLRHRSETIARTEALRATNYGVQDAWRQAIQTGKANETLVRRLWVIARDERRCEICSSIPGMNPKRGVQFGQPFATLKGPVMMPPIHPNCRCTISIRQWEPVQLGL
jgi:hypothetical protein